MSVQWEPRREFPPGRGVVYTLRATVPERILAFVRWGHHLDPPLLVPLFSVWTYWTGFQLGFLSATAVAVTGEGCEQLQRA